MMKDNTWQGSVYGVSGCGWSVCARKPLPQVGHRWSAGTEVRQVACVASVSVVGISVRRKSFPLFGYAKVTFKGGEEERRWPLTYGARVSAGPLQSYSARRKWLRDKEVD